MKFWMPPPIRLPSEKIQAKTQGKPHLLLFAASNGSRQLANELIDTAVNNLRPLKSRADLLISFAEFVQNRTK